jgi:hypothetical protein
MPCSHELMPPLLPPMFKVLRRLLPDTLFLAPADSRFIPPTLKSGWLPTGCIALGAGAGFGGGSGAGAAGGSGGGFGGEAGLG